MAQHRSAECYRRRRVHRVASVVGALLLGIAAFLTASPALAQAPAAGKVRLGHLSPTTPAVDAYIAPAGAAPAGEPVARGVAYGTVLPYLELAPGRYTVDMRPAGAAAGSAPVVTSAIDVAAGSAQSLMFFDTGAGGTVQGEVLSDDQKPAAAGSGQVRVVQAANGVGPVELQAAGGPRLASGLPYGTATDYAVVAAKAWDVAIVAGTSRADATLDVADGSVSTVVVTRDVAGRIVATPVVDVAGTPASVLPGAPVPAGRHASGPAAPATPQGGVGAGGGGTASGADPLPVLAALGGAVLLVFAVSEMRLRRSRHRA